MSTDQVEERTECLHIKANGVACQAFAIKGKEYCFFHQTDVDHRKRLNRALDHKRSTLSKWGTPDGLCQSPQMRRPFDDHAAALFHGLDLPMLEDPVAIQVMITNVIRAIATQQIDPRSAGIMLYGLQIAACNVKNMQIKAAYGEEYAYEVVDDAPECEFAAVAAAVAATPAFVAAAVSANSTPAHPATQKSVSAVAPTPLNSPAKLNHERSTAPWASSPTASPLRKQPSTNNYQPSTIQPRAKSQ